MLAEQVFISPKALFQEIGGEGVILDLATGCYFGLDGVGVRLWQLLQENPCLSNACKNLVLEYDVDLKRLEQDVLHLVTQLQEAELVTMVYR